MRRTVIGAAVALTLLPSPVAASLAEDPCANDDQRDRAREKVISGAFLVARPVEDGCIVTMAYRVAKDRNEQLFGIGGTKVFIAFTNDRFFGRTVPEGNMASFWDNSEGYLFAMTFYGTIDEPQP